MSASFRYVDLFAGIGGFHAALTALGGTCVYAVEIDEFAANVYEQNWGRPGGHPVLGDVTDVAGDGPVSDVIPEHDVLAAGFPCQPFSKSGAQRGMEEVRGTLFFNIMKIIKARHPMVVLLENVRNLIGPRHKHEWDVIISMLHDEGYRVSSTPMIVSPHRIPAELGGRPQVRERVFITATRDDQTPKTPATPDAVPTPSTAFMSNDPETWRIAEYLTDPTGPDTALTALSDQELTWIHAWDEWVTRFRKERGENPPSFPIWADAWVTNSTLEAQLATSEGRNYPEWKKNFLRKNSDLYMRNRSWIETWRTEFDVTSFRPSRRKLEWQAQDHAMMDCLVQLRPSGIRVKAPTYAPALVAIAQTSIYLPALRRLTYREAATLQGLPAEFSFGDQPAARSYKQVGNGVNVGAVYNAMKAHCERDADLLEQTAQGKRLHDLVREAPPSPDAQIVAELERYKQNADPH